MNQPTTIPGLPVDRPAVGQTVSVRKTVSETDIYLFAGLSGDFHPNHVDEEYMRQGRYGRRIAHGALMVAFMSAASTKMITGLPGTIVSYGFERVRFIKPVFMGDTVTVSYEIVEVQRESGKTFASVTCRNQRDEIVAVATHIMKYME